ncbi:hypothetical protein BD779DRAFT_1451518 [Infundibulicybe gibba]|nr:hypothetical protein BD779DRAFT_1451518 [Infundibulicybe gibba]
MTKIVNNLSAKAEMGSPMVCMYLLGNPDHYKSHEFALFYWQIALMKRHGKVFGLSPVHDYVYRPVELSGLSLYDWIRRCRREKLRRKKKGSIPVEEDASLSESEADISDGSTSITESDPSVGGDDVSTENVPVRIGLFPLPKPHPLAGTHGTRCVPHEKGLIPNFVGKMLPRADQGDREYYCSAMLALFKPWRTGADLKEEDETWDTAFLAHKFNERENELMHNFNLRYECLDARDDFHAQLHAGALNVPAWVHGDNEHLQDEEVGMEGDGCYPMAPEISIDDISEIGNDRVNVNVTWLPWVM